MFKSVSMRKPSRTRQEVIQLKSPISSQMLGLVKADYGKKSRSKYFIPLKLGTPSKNGHLTLIYAYLISCLWFSIFTIRKAM